MPLVDPAPARLLDPLQSVLMHLPGGIYGSYQALCDHISLDPTLDESVKEGLRYLSAARIGCAYCVTVRLAGAAGRRLLPDEFYDAIAGGRRDWHHFAPHGSSTLFAMADEVLETGEISDDTGRLLRLRHTEAEIVEALFYLLLIGASHRFSRALGIEAACAVPTVLASQAVGPDPTVISEGNQR